MPKKVVTSLAIPFKDLDTEKQIQWLIKKSQKVIERLPQLKKELAVYDDKSNELYNWDKSQIELFTNTYAIDLTTGDISSSDTSLTDFVTQLSNYADKDFEQLRFEATEKRIDSFIQSIKDSGGSERELNYVKELLDQMTEQDKENFTRSKLFWDYGNYASEGVRTFMDLYGITIGTANLENWCEQHGITTKRLYFEEGKTNKKVGRPKTK